MTNNWRWIVWALLGLNAAAVCAVGIIKGEYAAALPLLVLAAFTPFALRQLRHGDRLDVIRLELDIVRAILDGRRVRCQACGQFIDTEPADIGHALVEHNLLACPAVALDAAAPPTARREEAT